MRRFKLREFWNTHIEHIRGKIEYLIRTSEGRDNWISESFFPDSKRKFHSFSSGTRSFNLLLRQYVNASMCELRTLLYNLFGQICVRRLIFFKWNIIIKICWIIISSLCIKLLLIHSWKYTNIIVVCENNYTVSLFTQCSAFKLILPG